MVRPDQPKQPTRERSVLKNKMKVDMTAAAADSTPATATATPVAAEVVDPKAVAVRPDMAPSTYVQDNEVEGEFDASDYEKARLTIVAKTGKLSNQFTPGDMLFNTEFVIGNTKAPLIVIPVGYQKLYQNDLDFDGGEMGDTVKSATDVLDKGGIVGYRPFEEKSSTHFWKKILRVVFLVEKPDNVSPDAAMLFPFEIEGKDYAMAGFWASAKSAYNGVAIPLIQSKLKGSIRRNTYRLSTKGESTPDGSRTWIQTSLRATGPTTDAVKAFLADNAG